MEIKTIAKRWGNSIGVILPKKIIDERNIKENDIIKIEIKNKPLAKEFFGRFKSKFKHSAQELKDEARRGWS